MDIRKFVSLCDSTLTSNENLQRILAFVSENYNIDEKKNERLKEKIRKTVSKYKSKWQEARRIKERFNTLFQTWLDGDFGIEEFIVENLNSSTSASSSAMKRGRPSKPFSELSERGKRRIIDSQVVDPQVDSIEKALLLARRTAYHQKEINMVKVIGHILRNQESSNKMLAQLADQHGRMSAEEAFGVLIEAGLSKSQYEIIHRESPSRFPPYNNLQGFITFEDSGCSSTEDTNNCNAMEELMTAVDEVEEEFVEDEVEENESEEDGNETE